METVEMLMEKNLMQMNLRVKTFDQWPPSKDHVYIKTT